MTIFGDNRETSAVKRAALLCLLLALPLWSCSSSDNGSPGTQDSGLTGDARQNPWDYGVAPGQEQGTPPPKDGGSVGPDANMTPPDQINAHEDEACVEGLYQVNVGSKPSTCDTLWQEGGDVIQVTVGEVLSKPSMAGRTYTILSSTQVDLYPDDGEAIAVYIGTGSIPTQNITSGHFTTDPYTQGATTITGSYRVTLDDGTQLNGAFLADFCPFDPTGCD